MCIPKNIFRPKAVKIFFETVYKRHTNYSMEHIEQSFNDTPGADKRVIATISRNGDLVHDCYLKFEDLDVNTSLTLGRNNIPYSNYSTGYINNIDVKIGGQLIDRHYGDFLEAWAELTEKNYGATEATQFHTNDNDNTIEHTELVAASFIIKRDLGSEIWII